MEQPAEKNQPPKNHAAQHEEQHAPGANGQAQKVNDELKELQAQLKEKEQKYLYLYAEFENFKKRAIRERSDLLKFGWENAARELLEVVDNLERALAHMSKEGEHAQHSTKTLEKGLHMVLTQFRATLEKQGVQRIETGSQSFDPNLHEAVAHAPSELPEGKILSEEAPGYMLHGRLLRPARVVVSSGVSSGSAT